MQLLHKQQNGIVLWKWWYVHFSYNFLKTCLTLVNPLTPMSDQETISPYNINTISSRQVMSIKKNIN